MKSEAVSFEHEELLTVAAALQNDTLDLPTVEKCQTKIGMLREKRRTNDRFIFAADSKENISALYDQVFSEYEQLAKAYRKTSRLHGQLADYILQVS